MQKKEKTVFPKGFFTRPRTTITTKEALQDVVPIEWSKEETSKKRKTIICASKERKIL